MKPFCCLLALFLVSISALSSCKKGPAEKIGDKIDDATDSRPAEGVRDAVEKATGK
ncbi:MAG: hypothetical protein NTY98_08815 [Verrucomicrobia bacterium]|nr:hypothetical protein [Verrucomicrobiota bacterium]